MDEQLETIYQLQQQRIEKLEYNVDLIKDNYNALNLTINTLNNTMCNLDKTISEYLPLLSELKHTNNTKKDNKSVIGNVIGGVLVAMIISFGSFAMGQYNAVQDLINNQKILEKAQIQQTQEFNIDQKQDNTTGGK